MTRKKTGRLPRLSTPPSHAQMRDGAPVDLRGSRYSKLPNSAGSSSSDGADDPHPLPCYPSEVDTLAPVTEMPWDRKEKEKMKEMDKEWTKDPHHADAVTSQLLQTVVQEELAEMAAVTLKDMRQETDIEEAIDKLLEEDVIPDTLKDELYNVIWSVLYEEARTLSSEQLRDMADQGRDLHMKETDVDLLSGQILEGSDSLSELQQQRSLCSTPWPALVYHYGERLQQQALACNAALNMMQEIVAARSALAELLSVGLLASVEDDLDDLDDLEKIMNPPRRG